MCNIYSPIIPVQVLGVHSDPHMGTSQVVSFFSLSGDQSVATHTILLVSKRSVLQQGHRLHKQFQGTG